MNKLVLLVSFACLILAACSTDKDATSIPRLVKIWETDTTLITPESVIYDDKNEIFYVSCMGENPSGAFDGNGFIAKIDLAGEIIDNSWITGLNDPKGLALVGSTLYVTDLDKLVTIDIESGEAISTVVEGAEYLNDAASTDTGDILLTDTNLNTLYVQSGDQTSTVIVSEGFDRLNGVFYEEDRYLLAGFNSGKLFTLKDGNLTTVAEGLNTADGIEAYKDGYFVSCWDGHIYYLDTEWNKTLVNDTSEDQIGAADIDVLESKNLLVVPTFFGNTVAAYQIK